MSDPPPDKSATRRYSDNPTANEISQVAVTLDSYAGDRKAADDQTAEHNGKIHWWTRAGTIGSWIYTFITALVLIASIRSIQEARRATHYASKAAEAATKQAIVAADTEKRQLRAYVGPVFESFQFWCENCEGVSGPRAPGDPCTGAGEANCYVFDAKNHGTTPAYIPTGCGRAYAIPAGMDFVPLAYVVASHCNGLSESVKKVSPTIWPGESRRQLIPIGNEDIVYLQQILIQNYTGYLINFLTYTDIFNEPHHTYICRKLRFYIKNGVHEVELMGCNGQGWPHDD
jgi:hypothetical protein